MAEYGYYLKTMTVQIPKENKLVVIRRGRTVEYEVDRSYSAENGDTQVKRKVIGKVDPVQPERMFPNEAYFELFSDNEVPADVREEFLRDCEVRRDMKVIRRNPEEVVDKVVDGLYTLEERYRQDRERREDEDYCLTDREGPDSESCGSADREGQQARGSAEREGQQAPDGAEWKSARGGRGYAGATSGYAVIRRMFDEVYYAVEELAGKFPDAVMDGYKVQRINEVLEKLRESLEEGKRHKYLRLIDEPEEATDEDGNVVRRGLTYSDILLAMKWYKVLPR